MSPETQRVYLRRLSVRVYKTRPITQPFPCKIPFEFWLLQWQSDFPSVFENAPQTPTGISLKTLDALEAKYTDLITNIESSTPLSKEERGVVPNIPPNLPELVQELEMAEGRKDLSPQIRDRLDENLAAAKKSIVETWEKRRLENIEEKLRAAREDELDSAKNSLVGELMVYANTKDESVVNDARFDIAQDLENIILTASKPVNQNSPRRKEEIYADISGQLVGNTEKQLVGLLIQKYGLSAKTAQEVSTMALTNKAVEMAVESARKTIFVEHALANQFPKFTSIKETGAVSPEALHNLADETMAAIVGSLIQPIQEGQPKQADVLSTGLFKVLITKIIPPFNSPFLTSPASMTQTTRGLVLVGAIEEFLHKHAPQGTLRSIGPIRIDVIQSLILEASGFSNTSWWKNSTASFEGRHPFGLVHPQIRNSIILNHGALENLVALVPNGLIPSIKEFFNTNRGASWFGSFTKSAAMLPHLRFQFLRNVSLPLLGRLYRQNEWGYWVGPLARFNNTVFSRTIQFVGTSFIKLGSSKIMARFGGKILTGFGTKLLGLAGGSLGAAATVASSVLAVAEKFVPGIRGVRKILGVLFKVVGMVVGAVTGMLISILVNLAALSPWAAGGTLAGIAAGMYYGASALSVLGPWGILVGGFFGGIIGGIGGGLLGLTVGQIITFLSQGVGKLLETVSSFSLPSLSMPSLFSGGLSGLTAAPIIAVGGTGLLIIITNMVTTNSFFTPPEETSMAGSSHISIVKSVDVGGIKNPSNIGNNVIPGKVVYQLNVSARDVSLGDVIVTDKTTVANKDGVKDVVQITPRYLAERQGSSYVFKDKVPDKWDKTIDPQLEKLVSGASWQKLYGFVLTNEFKDSYISNTVTVTATGENGKTETKTITLTFKIGTPPLPPIAKIAENLVDRLQDCYKACGGSSCETRVNKTNFGDGSCVKNSKKNPIGVTFKDTTVTELRSSVSVFVHLQCVGFIKAVLTEAGATQPIPPYPGDAKDYFNITTPNYVWFDSSRLNEIRPGDVFVSKRFSGHIAIVHLADNDPVSGGFRLAEALGDPTNKGIVQRDAVFWTFNPWRNNPDIGFLRYTK